jgi:hypothetical protein
VKDTAERKDPSRILRSTEGWRARRPVVVTKIKQTTTPCDDAGAARPLLHRTRTILSTAPRRDTASALPSSTETMGANLSLFRECHDAIVMGSSTDGEAGDDDNRPLLPGAPPADVGAEGGGGGVALNDHKSNESLLPSPFGDLDPLPYQQRLLEIENDDSDDNTTHESAMLVSPKVRACV